MLGVGISAEAVAGALPMNRGLKESNHRLRRMQPGSSRSTPDEEGTESTVCELGQLQPQNSYSSTPDEEGTERFRPVAQELAFRSSLQQHPR